MAAPLDKLQLIDNGLVGGRPKAYVTLTVDVGKVLASWRGSLFAHEWMTPAGKLKDRAALPAGEQPKRAAIEQRLAAGETIEKPVLGIGLLENVEIGAGRATFLTLAALGARALPVHVPVANADEFRPYLAAP